MIFGKYKLKYEILPFQQKKHPNVKLRFVSLLCVWLTI